MVALLLVAVSLGLSNFAAALGLGVAGVDRRTRVRVGVVLGIFEAGMPVAGLLLGHGLAGTLAVGFALGTYRVSVALAAVLVGAVSVALSLLGLELGGWIGTRTGETGELISGLVLIGETTVMLDDELKARREAWSGSGPG